VLVDSSVEVSDAGCTVVSDAPDDEVEASVVEAVSVATGDDVAGVADVEELPPDVESSSVGLNSAGHASVPAAMHRSTNRVRT
jgi:hypothetical protein